MIRKTPAPAFFIFSFALLLCLPAQAKTYKFVMPTPKGLSMGSMVNLLKDMGKAIEKKTGLPVQVVNDEYTYFDLPVDDVLKQMNKKQVDFAMVFGIDFVRFASKSKVNAAPLFAISMFGKPYYQVCMYTRKSDNIKSAAGLKGKIWGGVKSKNARYIMHENGIDVPMAKFFSKLDFIPEENITLLLDALITRKIDAFTVPNYQVDMTKNANKKYSDVTGVACTEYEHNWFIVYNKDTVSKADADKVKQAFMVAHKDNEFSQFRFLLTAVKGRFVPFDPQNMKTTIKIAKLLDKYDWDEEENAFIKKHYKP